MTIHDARLYFVSGIDMAAGPVATFASQLAAAGVDLYQLREKEMEAGDLLRGGRPLRDACRDARLPFVINDRPDVAVALDADGVHVGQNDLPVDVVRRVAPDAFVGLSSHSREEIDALVAMDDPPDYFAVGPVYETPTKEGRPAAGLQLVRYAASLQTSIPWFAIGGIDHDKLPEVLDAGARRVVVVRAITDADAPVDAAARLADALHAAR